MKTAQKEQLPKHLATAGKLPIQDVWNDMVVLKDGSARAVLQIDPVCLAGYTDQEQRLLARGYAAFLNELTTPIQILIKSRLLDLQGYLSDVETRTYAMQNENLKSALTDYREFLTKLVPLSEYGVMRRDFYLVVPFELAAEKTDGAGILSVFLPKKTGDEIRRNGSRRQKLKAGLDVVTGEVQTAFEKIGLRVRRLPSLELIRLFVNVYHPSASDKEHEELFNDADALTVND